MLVKPTVRRPPSLLADVGIVAFLVALLCGLLRIAKHWQAPLQPHVEIELSLWALPGYTVLSLLRGVTAYGISLIFAITYGYLAARRPAAERVMIPLLDVLQSIPVLGFLPGAVLALMALFPRTNTGLELASILMIFTGQVWNMAFSVYQSLRSVPAALQEASALYQFNWWQRFRRVELPATAVGLAWNSMLAMAGGWFFLMVCEAFTLGTRDFKLPGLGAYISVAIAQHRVPAICAGITAMVLMIIVVDTAIWRPVLVWAQKFRMEETATGDAQTSLVLSWLSRSSLIRSAMDRVAHPISEWLASSSSPFPRASPRRAAPLQHAPPTPVGRVVPLVSAGVTAGVVVWALWLLWRMLAHLPPQEWGHVIGATLWTSVRVFGAIAIGSLWTVPVGIWIGSSDRRRARWQPFVQVAASFPAPMLYPLVLFVLHQVGWGLHVGAVVLMLLGTQWYILFNVIAGASAVPNELREVARSFRFTSVQRWLRVWWPAVFPYLVTGWVTAAGGAWNASIVAEYVSLGPRETFIAPGLGSLISLAASQNHYDLLTAGVLSMALVVVLINRFLWRPLYQLAEHRVAS